MSRFFRGSPKALALVSELAPSALCFDPATIAECVSLEKAERSFNDCFGTRQYHHVRVSGRCEAIVPFGAYTYVACNFDSYRDALVTSGVVVFVMDHRMLQLRVAGTVPAPRSVRYECQACWSDGEVIACDACDCCWHEQCRMAAGCPNCIAAATLAPIRKRGRERLSTRATKKSRRNLRAAVENALSPSGSAGEPI